MLNSASFWKPEAWVQTVIPDRSILVGKNWWKIPKFKWDILVIFKQCGYEKKLACEVTHSSSTKIGDWSLYKLPKIFPKDKSWVSSNPTFLYEAQALLCSLYSNAFVDKLPCLLHSDYPFSFRTISYLTLAILASTWFDLLL